MVRQVEGLGDDIKMARAERDHLENAQVEINVRRGRERVSHIRIKLPDRPPNRERTFQSLQPTVGLNSSPGSLFECIPLLSISGIGFLPSCGEGT